MYDRMKKHFTVNPKMLAMVWKQLIQFANTRLVFYEQMCTECYQLTLEPSSMRAMEVFYKYSSAS